MDVNSKFELMPSQNLASNPITTPIRVLMRNKTGGWKFQNYDVTIGCTCVVPTYKEYGP